MFKLYSQRQKEASGEPEVFIYDDFPPTFRNQLFTIVRGVFNNTTTSYDIRFYDEKGIKVLCEIFAQEKGMKYIPGDYRTPANSLGALEKYVDSCNNSDLLDLMDFLFAILFDFMQDLEKKGFPLEPTQYAIQELNQRLKQHSLGYEFLNGKIVKKTNTVTHENIVKPALKLLADEEFRGAEEEYLVAFEHYKKGENKDAILNANKAFESTMKIICTGMGYPFDVNKDTAQRLISILDKNGFYPSYLNNHMAGVGSTLKSGAPTLRNKTAGHGQGIMVQAIPDEFVEYALNLVATNILFLYRIYKEKRGGGVTE